MNIISNNCLAGYWYNDLNKQYENPFIWSSIKLSEFNKLIELYDDLDFTAIQIYFDKCFATHTDNREDVAHLSIDNKVTIAYTHHIQNGEVNGCIKHNSPIGFGIVDFQSNDVRGYLRETFKRRLLRMTEDPIFICFVDKANGYVDVDEIEFINLKTPYTRILITDNAELKQYESDKLHIWYYKRPGRIIRRVADDIKNEHKNFFNKL